MPIILLKLLKQELEEEDFEDDLVEANGRILKAIFAKENFPYSDFENRVKEITPFTRLTQSELFTGSNVSISLESELKKEILSADKIYFLVSFIKWSGIRILQKELIEFTAKEGSELKVITTSYMGATDMKAIDFLAGLPNTEVKVSYNTDNERLHAKSYLFFRNSGFNTGYIGSANLSMSALTSGLEWNLKVTSKEIKHIIDKFAKTFDTYWLDNEFETYHPNEHRERLVVALKHEKNRDRVDPSSFFDISPYHYQKEILEKLEVERTIHNRHKNLIVAATGTGKTVIAAFDFKKFLKDNPNAKLLYIAHRKEILMQARATFCGILRNNNLGELWYDGEEPDNYSVVFASVMTIKNRIDNLNLSDDYYDFIIVDEVHHIAAASYRPIVNKFKPQILLGLTATPERMDGENILEDFNNIIAAEIRLPEALNRKLLCPFQYFGITDSVDLSGATWQNGRYLPGELSNIYTGNDLRVKDIIDACNNYLKDFTDVRAIGYCVTKEHAKYMAEKFTLTGLKADYLISGERNDDRDAIRKRFQNKEINYLFVVDIFNEGIDIPDIDTVLFLRPTESLTVFLQQLGRGLRLAEGKECLSVLDFVGNSRPEYDFQTKFRALIGKTNTSTKEEIEKDFPHLPSGCAIILEKKAKEIILDNILNATNFNLPNLKNKILNFGYQTTLPLNLKNFTEFFHLSIRDLYKRTSWSRLLSEVKEIGDISTAFEKKIHRAIEKKWINCNSLSYLTFILNSARNNFRFDFTKLSDNEKLMLMMLYYDLSLYELNCSDLQSAFEEISQCQKLNEEIAEALEIIMNEISHIEYEISLPYSMPLKVHSRYTREQILTAFEENRFEKKSGSIEGVLNIKDKKTELLFVTLEKTEKDYSPTTMYNDYAVSETIFHWQSQNSARPDKGKGLSYVNQKQNNKTILLFVREKNEDEYGCTMSYVFLGKADYIEHYGSKPMNIKWQLHVPIPEYLWKECAKMAVG